ncbi:hypothetical protein A3I35_02880 [Candidatus Falkowbacteria bacterium RIFCSPLOWO2_02_FULL_45_15]|uniref:DUF4190 domain-containing protein n=2 Tax=Candidatus Falkowiibacteriota TaxID=1752728 RepID=A0A1F5RYF8_9BACT|nr:MAG: hypothetical protein A3D54_04290 [Candidatus Falkowbacteria bacterium RIFCSPHIGHO2_02_FULL_45_15]OGF19515.1 MAG: hypothetical protein A3I35_02880 [Candidatus Falkowbacteria bacterium RIFCSPLOWO2_02_FULL_45_15]
MKKLFIVLCLLSALSIFNITTNFVYAQVTPPDAPRGNTNITSGSGGPVSLTNPLTNTTGDVPGGIPGLIGRVINGVLGVVGSLALIMFIYGGLLWMTSGGNDEKVKQGKDVLIWATLGLFIIFASYALVNFIIFKGIGAVGGGSGGIQTDDFGRVVDPNNPNSN